MHTVLTEKGQERERKRNREQTYKINIINYVYSHYVCHIMSVYNYKSTN